MLRGEGGVYYEDLYPLVCFLPHYATGDPSNATAEDMLPMWKASKMDHKNYQDICNAKTSRSFWHDRTGRMSESPDPSKELGHLTGEQTYHSLSGPRQPEQRSPIFESENPLQPARNPPKKTIFNYLPFLGIFEFLTSSFRRHKQPELPTTSPQYSTSTQRSTRSFTGQRLPRETVDSNVPLEILLFLSSYLAWLLRNEHLRPAIASAFTTAITQLQDTVMNLDRIRNTPLPFGYQAHLRFSLWLYLFFLPVSYHGQYLPLS